MMSGLPGDDQNALATAAEAVSPARWDDALARLDADPTIAAGPRGLELRAEAAYGAGDPEGSIDSWETLYRLHLDAGDAAAAARAAAMVAMYSMIDTGLMSPIRGWLRRADGLADTVNETQVNAVIAMVRTYERLWCGDFAGSEVNAGLAIELGKRHNFPAAVLIGNVAIARLRIFEGSAAEGIDGLDDVAISLASGDVDAMTCGMAYCEMICAAQGLARYDRAAEWTQAMEQWRQKSGFGGFGGRCRVHRAEMLRLTGPSEQAEQEALQACEELRPWMRREFGWPLTELGTIRLRKGDLAGAEEAFIAAHEMSWSPQPGLALLRLAQGDVVTAGFLIADAIANPFDIPSKERPPYGGLRMAPLLDAQVEIAMAADDINTARRAADELHAIADTFHSQALAARAALARGRVALGEGRIEDATGECERALTSWIELDAPFEAAVVRMTLGQARQRAGNHDGALMEWNAAARAFEAYGAHGYADRARRASTSNSVPPASTAPIVSTAPTTSTAPTVPQGSVFRRDADTRTVSFDGRTTVLRDLLGMRYLERLLAEPAREFHALDLIAVERGSLPLRRQFDDETGEADTGHAGCHLDDQARDAYRRRLLDIDEDIEDATAANDLGRIALAQADRQFLVNELSRAVGLGGRARHAASTTERARSSVTRTIRYAIVRIADHHPRLGEHLRQAVATGIYCSYRPDLRLPTHWEF